MHTETRRQKTATFQVQSEHGETFTVHQFTTTIHTRRMDGTWMPPKVDKIEHALEDKRPVNMNSDGSFDVFTADQAMVRCHRA